MDVVYHADHAAKNQVRRFAFLNLDSGVFL
jgi:hypothetical protein